MKAFLGTGHLGSNFVKAMLRKGEQVQVWNRTASKAKALEADGAIACDTAAVAVQQAATVHMTLKDDDTVEEVLAMIAGSLMPGAAIIDHTTTSVAGAVSRTKQWADKGFTYLHAPVFMGPQNALDSTGNMLVSGDQEVIGRVKDALGKMTGKVINLGAETGKAAGMKLIGNLFLIAVTGGIADMLSLGKATGVSAGDIAALLDEWNPGTSVPARLKRMTGGDFSKPGWELHMARKDAGLMLEEARLGGVQLATLPGVVAEMDKWIDRGHAQDDWTIICKDATT